MPTWPMTAEAECCSFINCLAEQFISPTLAPRVAESLAGFDRCVTDHGGSNHKHSRWVGAPAALLSVSTALSTEPSDWSVWLFV